MTTLIARLKHPEDHYEFTDPKKANAVLMSLCQEAADALASPVQKPYRPLQDNGSQYFGDSWDTPPAAQPAPVQEPVAWGVDWGKAGDIPCVSIIKRLPGGGIEVVAVEYGLPTAQRQWVGLTDEEFRAMRNSLFRQDGWDGDGWDLALKQAIEAKLRSKNNG